MPNKEYPTPEELYEEIDFAKRYQKPGLASPSFSNEPISVLPTFSAPIVPEKSITEDAPKTDAPNDKGLEKIISNT
jgi:hypothetical protein